MRSICLTIVFASMASSLRCPSQWTLYQSNCYRYFSEVKSFWEASGFCRQQVFYSTDSTAPSNSELVSIHSLGENRFVNSIVPHSGKNVYIGLYHIVNAGKRTWHWVDGSPLDYTNWAPGQPDRSLQPYGALYLAAFTSRWDDDGVDLSFTCKMPADDCLTSPYESVNEDDDCKNGGNYRAGICVCPSPYSCIDCSWYNGCWSNPCQNGGKCINQEQSYSCECDDGFNGTHCEIHKGCLSNPCQNGGKCINQDQSYSCECDDGFTGTHCEIYKGCLVFPCKNGGNCTKDPEKSVFVCTCPEDYAGVTCQTYIGHCKEEPCENGGTCHSISVTPFYICQCKPPYIGSRCNATNYGCLSNPCLNGGTCVINAETNGSSCLCSSDYPGSTCGLQKLTSVVDSQSNTSLIVSFIVVTVVLTAIILLLVGYNICRSRRYKHPDATSFIGLQYDVE